MTTLIDTNLTLKYKNMVGLKNIITDTSNGLSFLTNVSINSNLFICGNSILNNLSINSNLYISGLVTLNNNATFKSLLNITGPVNINGSTSINSSLNILGNTNINNNLLVNGLTIYNGPLTNNSNMYVSNYTTFQNGIYVNNISGTTINFNSSIINIGNSNSMVFINGTASSIATSEILINDKLIALNVNSSNFQGIDIGSSCGIQIMGINSYGFIMTTSDASRYQIKSPLVGAPTNYITIQDLNNNLIISGTSKLIGRISCSSNILIQGSSILNSNTTINNSLNVSGSTNINSNCNFKNSLNINGSTIINNTCSMLSSVNINGLTSINNSISINSTLNISGSAIFNSRISANSILNISDITKFNNSISINSSLNVSSFTIMNGLTSINSYLNITDSCNMIGNHTINSGLFVSNMSVFNSTTTFKSSLVISGSSMFNNSVSINSNFGIFGQLISALPNYNLNIDAKNGGVPVWGWYRTGGIIKIRLNDDPPTIYLSGASSLFMYSGNYTDPGVYTLDYNPVYMISIMSGTSNILTSNILISGTSTLITQTSILPIGSYTTTYKATDLLNNIGYNYRLLNIYTPISISYNSTNIQLSSGGSVYFNASGLYQSLTSQWSIKPSLLTSIGLNYNNNWSVIIKGTLVSYGSGNYLLINFDSTWNGINTKPNGNYSNLGNPMKDLNHTNITYYFDTNICSFVSNNIYYFIISNNNSYLNVKVINNSGTQILNSSTLTTRTYQQNINLFEFYAEDNWQFTSNILLDPYTSNLTYQKYISIFGS